MSIKTRTRNGVCYMKPEGEMTIYNAAAIKTSLMNALQKGKEIEIDLAKVGEIDSAGFQLLLLAKREAGRCDKTLRLVNHTPAVLELLDLYQMAGHFGDPIVLRQQA